MKQKARREKVAFLKCFCRSKGRPIGRKLKISKEGSSSSAKRQDLLEHTQEFGKGAFLATELETIPFSSSNVDPFHEKEVTSVNKQLSLLIIEDNPDVVEYLESLLADQYQVEIARNGQEGIELALEQIPDLIISDVMMPEKDGFEVCSSLKNDQRTSHIPIVLLTAKADEDSRLTGLKRGADAYLAKPFNPDELFIRLEKLHQLRLQLQARFSSLDQEEEATSTYSPLDDAFMTKLRAIVEANLDQSGILHS